MKKSGKYRKFLKGFSIPGPNGQAWVLSGRMIGSKDGGTFFLSHGGAPWCWGGVFIKIHNILQINIESTI